MSKASNGLNGLYEVGPIFHHDLVAYRVIAD